MGLQWMLLTYAVAAEAAIFLLISLPSPKLLKTRIVSLISLILQPLMFIVPFAGFQLLVLLLRIWRGYAESCCHVDFELYKSQRNVILCASACLLYWCIYRVCKYYKDIQNLEEVEKRYKKL
uniref:Endoplasmic reticulum transmembrane protein n=1 Tax=Chenopodium quinoa TaxID=63459 RepID=A0A803MVS6_CHEQI